MSHLNQTFYLYSFHQLCSINFSMNTLLTDKKTELENGMAAEKKLLAKVVRASEKAKKEFEDFEKRDLKVREDLKHNKAKIKKLTSKVETEKTKVRNIIQL